jgi:hypothetical protein
MAKIPAGMLAAVLAVLLSCAGGSARADGALAVGSTGDVVRDGVAFGMVVDEPKATAAATALERCRTFKARAAAERCSVVATFSSGECFAVAYDPKPGTPGAGWGIGPDQATANGKAIAMCEETAGPGRKGYCRVESAGCDTAGPAGAKTKTETTTTEERQPTEWSELRERFRSSGPSGSGWDVPLPVLLLVGVAAAGVAYIVSRTLKGKAGPAPGRSAKAKAPAVGPARRKTKGT